MSSFLPNILYNIIIMKFNTDVIFDERREQEQQEVLKNYWSATFDLTSCKPIPLNDTTLISNRAYPSKDYNHSDYIKIWPDPPDYDEPVFSGEVDEAWLYKMTQTDISIALSGNTVIVWPYESINPSDNFPSYYPEDFASICTPLPISNIDFSKAIAGNALSSSDVIYKITNYQDSPEQATECCWLSGQTKGYPATNIIKTGQTALQFIAPLVHIQNLSGKGQTLQMLIMFLKL